MKKKRTVGFSTFEHCLKKELNEQRFVLGPMPLFIAAGEGGESRQLWEAGLLHSIICVNRLPIKHVLTHFCNDLQKENTFICLIVISIREKTPTVLTNDCPWEMGGSVDLLFISKFWELLKKVIAVKYAKYKCSS